MTTADKLTLASQTACLTKEATGTAKGK